MNTFLEIVLVIAALISVIPVVNLTKNKSDSKYLCLKILIYTTALWTLFIFIERTVADLSVVYYVHMLGFPIKFLLSSLMLCTIFQYIGKSIPKWLVTILALIFVSELLIALSNGSLQLLLSIKIIDLNSFKDLYINNYNLIFYIHLALSYGVLILSVTYMFIFLSKHQGIRQYKSVTKTMVISVFLVLGINLIDFLSINTHVDLTYISLVFASHALYIAILKQDMIFNLRTSGQGEILHNMREIYVLTDQDKQIVDISPTLLSKYEIDRDFIIGKNFDLLSDLLSDRVVLYSDRNVDIETDENKDHYHLREKVFNVKGMSVFGYMILLYDETQVYKLLRELNHLSNYDMMTGLHNRNYIEYIFSKIKDTSDIGIISLDLNGLKINNDYLGHERGDYLLKSLADRVKRVMFEVKDKDIARIGGDEFLVIIRNTSINVLDQIKKDILNACYSENIEDLVSVSIGTAFGKNNDLNIFQLVHEADKKMYEMKDQTSSEYKNQIIEYIKVQNKYIR